ncbi:MAG: YidC/Oxa1 family insertase periplasmic-domain containing protein, partial [Planctomycetota bacterium]
MKIKTAVIAGISVFCLCCVGLVVDSAMDNPAQAKAIMSRVVPLAAGEAEEKPAIQAAPQEVKEIEEAAEVITTEKVITYPQLSATSDKLKTASLGEVYPIEDTKRTDDPEKYKFRIEFTSKGAAVRNVTLSEFKNRDLENPAPLMMLSPLLKNGEVYSLANTSLKVAPAEAEQFGKRAFPLNKLNWKLVDSDATDQVQFEAVLSNARILKGIGIAMLKITKTYRIQPGSYDLICDVAVKNLSTEPIKVMMQMQGPGGMDREAVRQDSRKVKAAYKIGTKIETEAIDAVGIPKVIKKDKEEKLLLQHKKKDEATQIWSALTNKYFAAIVRPVTADGQDSGWLQFKQAQYYGDLNDTKTANCSYSLVSESISLAAAGEEGAEQSYSMQVYMGPKDKKIFEKNETYRALAYFQTIDFRGCCCPASVIAPMAFAIMWLMNTMYGLMGPFGNYGVVIMILVFFVRLLMHPITKKSQVSMMKMQKLGPKMQEIQKKYANNKQEMNKQVMQLYRDGGVSPVSSMVPMMLQMPIWIALWTAVYTSIDLRGAGFLPFWITDLSVPDRLFLFPGGINIPYIGEYFNLLPLLMGGVMYLQQKMMPSAQASATQPNSQ